jgi:glycosyltransferase involved in cell wall biosynthesis
MVADEARPTLISVIIPTTRRPDLLMRALHSVFTQTHQAVEIIVVVDGPNRETIELLAQLNDTRLMVIQNERPLGAGAARNRGAGMANGEWLAFLDDDDEWLPDKLARQLTAATGSEACLISCCSRVITPLGVYVWPRRVYDGRSPVDEYLFDRRSLFQGDTVFATSTILVSKEIFDQTGFGTTAQREDTTLLLRIAKQAGGKLFMMPDILVVLYQEEARESLGNSYSWREMLDWMDTIQRLVTRRAYSGFCLIYLGSQAARHRDYGGFFELLARSFKYGRPRPIHLLIFVLFWILPIGFRRRVRSSVLLLLRTLHPAPPPPLPRSSWIE